MFLEKITSRLTQFLHSDQIFWYGYLLVFWAVSYVYFIRENGTLKNSFRLFLSDLSRQYLSLSSVNDAKLFGASALFTVFISCYVFNYDNAFADFTNTLIEVAKQKFPPTNSGEPPLWQKILFDFSQIISYEFFFYFWHLSFHKIPALWSFHKIHHSAEVLTPLTSTRGDPTTAILYATLFGFTSMFHAVVYYLIFRTEPGALSILGVPACLLFFWIVREHFLHSNLWISYGWLNYVIISPAQHQIHHSYKKEHRDKNIGNIFSFMDLIFGTFYMTTSKREPLELGIDGIEEKQINQMSLLRLCVYPYESLWKLHKQKKTTTNMSTTDSGVEN